MLDLGVLCIFFAIISSVVSTPCIKPSVRKEWRALSTREKAAWIRAINVRVKHTAQTSATKRR